MESSSWTKKYWNQLNLNLNSINEIKTSGKTVSNATNGGHFYRQPVANPPSASSLLISSKQIPARMNYTKTACNSKYNSKFKHVQTIFSQSQYNGVEKSQKEPHEMDSNSRLAMEWHMGCALWRRSRKGAGFKGWASTRLRNCSRYWVTLSRCRKIYAGYRNVSYRLDRTKDVWKCDDCEH